MSTVDAVCPVVCDVDVAGTDLASLIVENE
jgi:hypothetical protein